MTDTIRSAGVAGTTVQGPAGGGLSKLSADFESFLRLLTAQVSNQDPLAPMDSSTFVTQLAQLSQVEQSVQMNAGLAQVAGRLAVQAGSASATLIGREVSVELSALPAGPEGRAFDIRPEGIAGPVTIEIVDAEGIPVRMIDVAEAPSGQWRRVEWDGRDDRGASVPEGDYTVTVSTGSTGGGGVPSALAATSIVRGVSLDGGISRLILDTGEEIEMGEVLGIR